MVPSHVSLFTLLFKINVYSLLYCLTLTSFSSSSLWFSIPCMLYFTEYAMTWHMYILHTCVCVCLPLNLFTSLCYICIFLPPSKAVILPAFITSLCWWSKLPVIVITHETLNIEWGLTRKGLYSELRLPCFLGFFLFLIFPFLWVKL